RSVKMKLQPEIGSRGSVDCKSADYADECPKPENLVIHFLNAENSQKFKVKFEESQDKIRKKSKYNKPEKTPPPPTFVHI
uniref:RanBD1 domain-containing protein n=1 Tax=Salarias fasciatus TaxID=181472 RepID=A0A672GJ24_SALFA